MTLDFSKFKILVLGDIFLDEYQFGECTRISQEAPVPIVKIDYTKTKRVLGGAVNVGANVISLGAQCTLGCKIGADILGCKVVKLLSDKGIGTIVSYTPCPTSVKTRIIAQNQQIVRLDQERDGHTGFIGIGDILTAIQNCDAIILSDYAKGYFDRKNIEQIIEAAKKHNKLVVVDTKPCNVRFFEGADWITPNQKEYQEMSNIPFENILITKGSEGMECQCGDLTFNVPAIRREVVDVAGAGDTVVAAFTLALINQMSIQDAVNFANKAAGVVVGKQGTSTVTVKEIESLEAEIYGVRVEDPAQ